MIPNQPTTSTPTEKPKGSFGRVAMRISALQAVSQTYGSFEVKGEVGDPPYAAAVSPPIWNVEQAGNILRVFGTFSFKGVRDFAGPEGAFLDDDSKTFVDIHAQFVATYELHDSELISSEDCEEFARVNGHLNLHPFWREFVVTCLGRAGLPRLSIPVFNPIKAGLVKPESPAQVSTG